uniref:Putative tick transposon n=1 Tax=Ixodes scapularis TaxID=6945 RepID=A0A4D5RCW0_IXOSC
MSVIGNFCLLQLLLSGIADFGNVTLGETVSLRHTPGDRRGIPDDRNQQPDHRWTTQHLRHDSLYRLRSGTSADILDERHKRTIFDRSGFSGKGGGDRANMSVIGNFCLLQVRANAPCYRSDDRFLLLLPFPQRARNLLLSMKVFFISLLILAGDVEENPGPDTDMAIIPQQLQKGQSAILSKLDDIEKRQTTLVAPYVAIT